MFPLEKTLTGNTVALREIVFSAYSATLRDTLSLHAAFSLRPLREIVFSAYSATLRAIPI
jgi:hypothetical protein